MRNESVSAAIARLTAFAATVRRSHLLLAAGVGLCCSAGLLLTVASPLNQAGGIDTFIYVGYTHDYPGLLARFGPTYYSERIAYIYPQRVLAHLFGPEGGYFTLRFVALAAAVAAIFAIAMRFYGFAPALLAAVWLSFTPWLPRALLWTYVDGLAIVYLIVGAALLIVPTRRRLASHVAVGAAFALAVDCNLFVLAICGLLSPGWAFFYRREGLAWLVRAVLALAVGFFATYFVLAAMMYMEFPDNGFFSFEVVTIRLAFSGADEIYFKPLSSLVWEGKSFILLIPVTFVLAAFLVVARRSSFVPTMAGRSTEFALLAISYLAGTICLSLIFHFGIHDAWLSVPYYRSYFLPGCALALVVLGGEAQRRGGRIFGDAAVFGGTGLVLLAWLAHPALPHLAIALSWCFWLAVAAVAIGAAVALRRTAAASVVLVAAAVLLSLCVYDSDNSPYYEIRDRPPEREAAEWDVYRGAIFLQQFVNAHVRPEQSIGFWYRQSDEPRWLWLNSIQSTYLWGFTRVFSANSEGMPLIDEDFHSKVAGRRFLVLLGLSDAETNTGLAALEKANMPFLEVKRTHFRGKLWGYTAVLIEINPPKMGQLMFKVPM